MEIYLHYTRILLQINDLRCKWCAKFKLSWLIATNYDDYKKDNMNIYTVKILSGKCEKYLHQHNHILRHRLHHQPLLHPHIPEKGKVKVYSWGEEKHDWLKIVAIMGQSFPKQIVIHQEKSQLSGTINLFMLPVPPK